MQCNQSAHTAWPFISRSNRQRYCLNRSSYLCQKISIHSNRSSNPFKKISIRLNGWSYPFKKISIRSNGSSYPFKKICRPFERLELFVQEKLTAFGTVRAVLFKKIRQPFQLSVGKNKKVTRSFHWKVKCCE